MSDLKYITVSGHDMFYGMITYNDIKIDNGVYYWHYYVPCSANAYSPKARAFRNLMLDYKGRDTNDWKLGAGYKIRNHELFACEIFNALRDLAIEKGYKKLALIAVPKSTVKKPNGLELSIKVIADIYHQSFKNKAMKDQFLQDVQFYDYSKMLIRTTDIPSMHKAGHYSVPYQTMYDSISCTKELEPSNKMFVIIDDILTTGQTLQVCEDILKDHGADPEHIIKVAIAKTIH